MTSTEKNGILVSAAAAVAIVLLAGVAGHLKGKADSIADALSDEPLISRFEPNVQGETVGNKSDSSDPLRLEKIHKRLRQIWNSPTIGDGDPEAQAQTSHLLAQMSSAEIEAFLRSMPPGSESHDGTYQMVRCILSGWILRDGPAALAYLDVEYKNNTPATNGILESWVRDQPETVLPWLNYESTTPVQQQRVEQVLLSLLENDPDRAFKQLSTMKGKDVADQLWLWAIFPGEDPEMRKRLLDFAAATGNPEDLASVRSSIAHRMAGKDPEAAREFVRNLQADSEEQAELEAAITTGVALEERESAYTDWLQRNTGVTEIPATIQYGISDWINDEPEDTIKWLAALPAGTQRDLMYENSIPALAGNGSFDEAAKLVENIDSPSLRADALNALQTRWLLVDPEKAMVWKSGLSAEDEAVLRK